jgi:hypothetical protein
MFSSPLPQSRLRLWVPGIASALEEGPQIMGSPRGAEYAEGSGIRMILKKPL